MESKELVDLLLGFIQKHAKEFSLPTFADSVDFSK